MNTNLSSVSATTNNDAITTENATSNQQTEQVNQNIVPTQEQQKGKKTRKTNHCREDHDNKQLIVTKETSKPGTAAFNELMEKRKLYPDYRIVYRTVNSSENHLSVKGLTEEKMKTFISLSYPNDAKRLNEFNLQKQLSELYPTPITYLRNWFRRNYRAYWDNARKSA